MITPVQLFSFTFISDGTALSITVDVSLAPFNQDFAGNLPEAVLEPTASSLATGPLSGLTASVNGTEVTITFPEPPPQYDGSENLIVYSATFLLEYGINPTYAGGPNFNQAQPLVGTVGSGNKVFTLPSTPKGSVLVTMPTGSGGALIMTPGTDYTLVGTTVTFTSAPAQTPIAYY
jgi:hypothetical protein